MHKTERHQLICGRIRRRMTNMAFNPTSLSLACKDLASDEVGFERNYVRSLFRGLKEPDRIFIPVHEKLLILARVLKTSVDYLYGDILDDFSIDATDLIPDTANQKLVLGRMKGLSDADQERARQLFELTFPNREKEDPVESLDAADESQSRKAS